MEEVSILNYLTMCDVADGWEIKPGFRAPLCDPSTNTAIKDLALNNEQNLYAQSIKEKRAKAIELINKILDGPINYVDKTPDLEKLSPSAYQTAAERAVNAIFLDNKYGQELIKLLCPTLKIERLKGVYGTNASTMLDYQMLETSYEDNFNEKYFAKLNPLAFIAGYVFAAGCAMSGSEQYKTNSKESRWHPDHYISGKDISKNTYAQDKDKYPDTIMPYIEFERLAGRTAYATELGNGINSGQCFGA